MKQLHLLLVSLAALVGAASVLRAETYVRPGAGYFAYTDSHYDNKAGATLALGTAFGPRLGHEIELEVDRVAWEGLWLPYAEPGNGMEPPSPIVGGVTATGKGHLLPVLLGYRFRTGNADSIWRFYAGASIGATHVTGDLSSVQALAPPYGSRAGSVSSWRTTWGGAAGLEVHLSRNLSLDIGYRFRVVDGPTVTLRDRAAADMTGTQDLGTLSTHVVAVSLGWTF